MFRRSPQTCHYLPSRQTMRQICTRVPIRGRGYTLASQACGPLMCNMYAMVCGVTGDAVLIDPATHEAAEFDRIQTHLEGTSGVTHVLLTHGHPDHVAGVADAMKAWPNASLHIHPLEGENYGMARALGEQFGLHIPDLPEPTHSLDDGDVIKVGESIELSVMHTPGHSPGHVAFVDKRPSEDNQGSVVASGDLLFRGSVGRTDFFNSSVDDLLASLRRLYEELDDETIVLSGHTTPTYLKEERQSNPYVAHALQQPFEWFEEATQRNAWREM